MRNYRNVLKLLLIDLFRRRQKQQIAIFILLGLFYLMMAATGVGLLVAIAPTVVALNLEVELITIMLLSDFVITIVLGLVASISFLYLSKDNEFFLNLPIKPQAVFMAKFTMVYITEALASTAILLPTLIAGIIALGLPPLAYLIIPIAIIAVPLVAMIFIGIISMPLVYLITLFRNRGTVTTLIVIALFSVFMALYFSFIFSTSTNSDQPTYDITPFADSIKTLATIFYPFYMLVKFATLTPLDSLSLPLSMLIQMSVFLVSITAISAISYFVTLGFYAKVNSRVLERGTAKAKTRNFTQTNPFRSFIKKEFKEILRDPTVALQALAGVILCPLVVVMISASMSKTFSVDEELISVAQPMFWMMGIMMLMSIGVGTNAGANFCISREGGNFYYLKILPVPYQTQIRAKHTLYLIIGFCSTTVATIAFAVTGIIMGYFVWWIPVLILMAIYPWVYAITSISIYMDLKNPKLDFKSIKEIVKRGKNSLTSIIWTFSSMFFSGAILVSSILQVDKSLLIIAMGLAVYIISGLIFALIFHKKLYNNADMLFETTEL